MESKISKSIIAFLLSHFSHDQKAKSRRKEAFNIKQKYFFSFLKGISIARNCLRRKSGPLMNLLFFFISIFFYLFIYLFIFFGGVLISVHS